jgi:hypothetical protein
LYIVGGDVLGAPQTHSIKLLIFAFLSQIITKNMCKFYILKRVVEGAAPYRFCRNYGNILPVSFAKLFFSQRKAAKKSGKNAPKNRSVFVGYEVYE